MGSRWRLIRYPGCELVFVVASRLLGVSDTQGGRQGGGPAELGSSVRPRVVRPVSLGELLAAVPMIATEDINAVRSISVTGVAQSSRDVRPGDLYIALPGRRFHGADFVDQASRAGAVAVLTDEQGADRMADYAGPVLTTPDPRVIAGEVASVVFGQPSSKLRVIGITGTNGKTTTAYLVEAALRAAGHTTGLIGTVETRIGDGVLPSERTTPEAAQLQALLAYAVERGVTTLVMEVSSHALALHRAEGIQFAVGAFTNLSVDHLDFHVTMDEYFAAKARLFDGRARSEIIVIDDEGGRRLAATRPNATTVASSGAPADWQAGKPRSSRFSQSFQLRGLDGVEREAGVGLPGEFNIANAALAVAIVTQMGVDVDRAIEGVRAAAGVPGRMERVNVDTSRADEVLAVVDYAHAPDGVVKALSALRGATRGKLICVLGCGGDRDASKRPLMGQAAAEGADVFVATDDNPRSEDPALVRGAMLKGAFEVPESERASIMEIADRAQAIAYAVTLAAPGDTIAVLGKGHETGQEIADKTYPFDDRVVLARALATGRVG